MKLKSFRAVDILLGKLLQFEDYRLSHVISDLFKNLFSLGLISFNEFLETCFFKTSQMNTIRYLDLKKFDKETGVNCIHSSCLIDQTFMEKYCHKVKAKQSIKEIKADQEMK